ncbi:hypothetical protein ACQKE0_01695 [Shewanella colwelliana]|uniref:hypothetical protein n=1 Tax=Shewanella colwelliana TaxID=23 RepID=UPI003CFEC511
MNTPALQQYHDQLKAEMDLTHFIAWFDKQIALHRQAILRWPHDRATFTRLINQCEQAKQTMLADQQALKLKVTTQKGEQL